MKNLSSFLGLALLATAVPLAHAGLEINYKIGANPIVTCPIDSTANLQSTSCANVTTGTFLISGLEANSNSPGDSPTFETSATSTFQNTGAASATIVINVISTDFTTPTAPPALILLSHIGGTDLSGGGNSVSFISCIDTSDSQVHGCPATDNAPTINPTVSAGLSYDGDSQLAIATLGTNYALDEQITITLTAGSKLNFSGSSTLIQTPEPMSIALLGGILLFTTGAIRRKRNQASRG